MWIQIVSLLSTWKAYFSKNKNDGVQDSPNLVLFCYLLVLRRVHVLSVYRSVNLAQVLELELIKLTFAVSPPTHASPSFLRTLAAAPLVNCRLFGLLVWCLIKKIKWHKQWLTSSSSSSSDDLRRIFRPDILSH